MIFEMLDTGEQNARSARELAQAWKDGQPLKGVTLSDDEARSLLEALQGLDLEGLEV